MTTNEKYMQQFGNEMMLMAKGFVALMNDDKQMTPDEVSTYVKTIANAQSSYEYYKELVEGEQDNAQ